MNKTTAVLVAIIIALVGSFAWYAAKHPDRGPGMHDEVVGGALDEDARNAGPRSLSADVSGAGLDTLALQVGVGEVHVTASNDDTVHAEVTLRPKEREFLGFLHWSGATGRSIAAAAIHQERQDKRLTLSLDLDGHDQDEIKQEWEVQVPARLKLDSVMNVGEMDIVGVAGGVGAKLDVGELEIDVPKGSIDADVNVGEIRAKSGSSHHGRIQLASNIGDATLLLHGSESGVHEHGGLGNRVTLDGDGPDSMDLKLNIGEVTLHLEPQDDKSGGGT
ncbi:MAG TPA: hypothetical protein VGH91_07545 [Gammaproteobacteria bacterium]|jgi:hypothetical protein